MLIQAGVLCKWTNDTQRLLLEHFDTINNSPSCIYHNALPFSPSSSWLHKHYPAELLQVVKVVKGLPAEWGKCSHKVLLNHMEQNLSCWNNTIAVGGYSGVITILDVITGNQVTVLSGHTGMVQTLTFAPDGKSLISGSNDKTVKLWDMQTGGIVKTFSGHTSAVLSVSLSPSSTIASGSEDMSIHLWDSQTGECHCVIEQQGFVTHVCFSPTNPQHFLSVCDDKVWQWDINGHQVGPTSNGSHIAFSPDGTQFVVCTGTAVTVQNFNSGVTVAYIPTVWMNLDMDKNTRYCCFSPDGRLVAVLAGGTSYVWDITSSEPCLIGRFSQITSKTTSLAFSSPSSLISVSYSGSVQFWQIGTPSTNPVMTDLESTYPILFQIRSATMQARDGIIITSDSNGMVKTWDIPTGLCKAFFQTPVKDIFPRDVQLIDGRVILSWYADGKINIWDAMKGEPLLTIDGVESQHCQNFKISEDGSRVFSLMSEGSYPRIKMWIHAWSIQTGEPMGRVDCGSTMSIPGYLTVDSSQVWLWTHPIINARGWDFGISGLSPIELPSRSPEMLHPSGVVLWNTDLSQLKDKATGGVVFQLPERYGKPWEVQWNDQCLFVHFEYIKVLILDFSHMLLK